MVAKSDRINACRKELLANLGCYPFAGSSVLAIDDREERVELLNKLRQEGEQGSPASAAHNITDEENPVHAAPDPIIALMPEESPEEQPTSVEPGAKVVVPHWVQVVALVLSTLLISGVAGAAVPVLVLFTVASVIALILNPLVTRVSSRLRLRRAFAVVVVYLGFFISLVIVGALVANPVTDQVSTIQKEVPTLTRSAGHSLDSLQKWTDARGLKLQIKSQGQPAVSVIQKQLSKSSGDIVSFTQSLLQSAASFSLAVILVIVLSIYMLLYAESIGRIVRSVMPPGDGSLGDDYPTAVQRAVFGYVRGQLLFSLVMGFSAGLAMWLAGVIGLFPDGQTYAVFFGVFYGLMELVPFIGPVLGAVPPILLALVNDPLTALWVALIFIALQQIEGHIVAPQVFSHSLRINPLVVLFALLLGASLYGVVGALMALPLTAVVRETVQYLRRHVVLEPWGPTNRQVSDP